jgi:tellurite resistance protein
MTIMMLSDGRIEDSEIRMMKDIYRKVLGNELLDYEIEDEIDICKRNPMDMEEFVKSLFPYLNDHGKEMILKISYYVAIADSKYTREEEKLVKNIGQLLQLSSAHIKGIINEVHG